MQVTDLPPLNPYGVTSMADAPAPAKPALSQPRWTEGLVRAVLLALIVSLVMGIIGATRDWQAEHPGNQTMWRWQNRFGLNTIGGFFTLGIVFLAAGVLTFVPSRRFHFTGTLIHCFFTYLVQCFSALSLIVLLSCFSSDSDCVYDALFAIPIFTATFFAWMTYIGIQLRHRLKDEAATDELS